MPPQNDAAAREWAMQNYGNYAWFLNDPELGPLLLASAYKDENPMLVEARVRNTNWYRSRSDAEREFDLRQQFAPVENARLVGQMRATVNDAARSMGLAGIDVGKIAQDAVRKGFNEAQVQDILAGMVTMGTKDVPGRVNSWFAKGTAHSKDYGVYVSDEEKLALAKRVASGELMEEDMEGFFRDRAKRAYAYDKSIVSHIDAGGSVDTFFQPHKQAVAEALEISPAEVDLRSTDWAKLTRHKDPETGEDRAMTLTEAARYARNDPRWTATKGAKDRAARDAVEVGKMFGVMA